METRDLGIGDRVMVDLTTSNQIKDESFKFGKILVKYGSAEDSRNTQTFCTIVSITGDIVTVPFSAMLCSEMIYTMIDAVEREMIRNNLLPYLGCFPHISSKGKNEGS